MKSVVVTGASTGIGLATCKALIDAGFHVFGSVRRTQDANRLSAEFGSNFTPLLFDVTEPAAVQAAAKNVRVALNGETLKGLVNNAGVVVGGPLTELPIEAFRRQLEINLTGQLIVTQAFAPLLGTDRALKGPPGRIVMMSSASGKNAIPFIGPYAASKHALEGLSESLRRELMLFGIDVIVIGPGAVKTPIWEKAEKEDISAYRNTPYAKALDTLRDMALMTGRRGIAPERVARLVLHALTARRPRVRYAIDSERFVRFMSRILPKRFLDRVIARRIGLTRKEK
jgi:NAD(P)-dependent dehydrogenase (short-subunit alcohol dehydrogenase family)